MPKRKKETFADMQGINVNSGEGTIFQQGGQDQPFPAGSLWGAADDLIIAAINETEHEAIMHRVLQHARIRSVVVNARNIHFKVTTVPYMRNIVTKDGMRPDPEKVDAIIGIPKPTTKHDLLRLLGMIYPSVSGRTSVYSHGW